MKSWTIKNFNERTFSFNYYRMNSGTVITKTEEIEWKTENIIAAELPLWAEHLVFHLGKYLTASVWIVLVL